MNHSKQNNRRRFELALSLLVTCIGCTPTDLKAPVQSMPVVLFETASVQPKSDSKQLFLLTGFRKETNQSGVKMSDDLRLLTEQAQEQLYKKRARTAESDATAQDSSGGDSSSMLLPLIQSEKDYDSQQLIPNIYTPDMIVLRKPEPQTAQEELTLPTPAPEVNKTRPIGPAPESNRKKEISPSKNDRKNVIVQPDVDESLPKSVLVTPSLAPPSISVENSNAPTRQPLARSESHSEIASRPITESEMLSLALSNSPVLRPLGLRILENPQAAATVFDHGIAASDPFFGPQAALSAFDTNLSASALSQNNDRVFNNSTLGGDVQELTQDYMNMNARAQKRSLSGAVWDLTTSKQYDANNRQANRFPNYWETQLEAGVRQPLLRGAGKQFNSIAGPNAQPGFYFSNGITIARLNNKITDADFEIAVRNFVRDLYTVYWDLKRQYRSYESIVAARDLAHRTWQSVRAKSEARLDGGEANKEAQSRAKYYRYCRDAEIALGGSTGGSGLYATERQLRLMIGLETEDGQLLRPSQADTTAQYTIDFDSILMTALANRVELRRQSMAVQKQQLQLVASKNFLLPQLDMIGRYRLRGFGDDLTGSGADRFASAYKDFFSLDHQEVEFGVEMGVTAGRRQARAAVRNATLKLAKERNLLAEQQRALQFRIKDAISEIDSAYEALSYSRLQFEADYDRLRSSEVLFESDKIQIEFLLDAQEELLQAELHYANDLSRYSVAIVSLNAESGSLLSDAGVRLAHDCNQTQTYYSPENGNHFSLLEADQ